MLARGVRRRLQCTPFFALEANNVARPVFQSLDSHKTLEQFVPSNSHSTMGFVSQLRLNPSSSRTPSRGNDTL